MENFEDITDDNTEVPFVVAEEDVATVEEMLEDEIGTEDVEAEAENEHEAVEVESENENLNPGGNSTG